MPCTGKPTIPNMLSTPCCLRALAITVAPLIVPVSAITKLLNYVLMRIILEVIGLLRMKLQVSYSLLELVVDTFFKQFV